MEMKELRVKVLLEDVCNGVPKFLAEIPKDGVRFKTTPNLDCVVLFRVEERGKDVQDWVTIKNLWNESKGGI